MRRAFIVGLFAALLSGCATPDAPTPHRFEGTWEFHFETSSFVGNGGEGPYWLSGEGEVWPQLTAPFSHAQSPWGRAHIVVEGELSEPGQYGHLGAYGRELRVTRVISSQLISASHQPSGS